ncbi:MAG: FAD-dependent oxidoreductase [Proteobacteria bacterium]|nr:FAD-dependent oxidoreductase [Pseudomonadota bacterium]
MTAASDVIIIGAGIAGSAAAFFLRQRGCSVTLIERGLAGQQASGVNFGNVRRQGRRLEHLALSNRASVSWRRMRELVGEDIEYIQEGHIRICYRDRPELLDNFAEYAGEARVRGLELEIVTGTALRQRFPFFGPDVLGGSYSALDGHANPRLVAPAFARAAKRNGAEVIENCEILQVEKAGEDFLASAADGRRFHAPILLVTAGAWGNRFSTQFGEPVPLVSHGPTMCVTEPVPYSIRCAVGVVTPVKEEDLYFRQIPRGNIIIGGGPRNPSYPDLCRAYVMPRNTLNQFKQLRRLAPELTRLNILRVWSGVEGYFPDEQPVMGPSRTTSGLYYAFGFSGGGFQLGPGVGDVMAELIATGQTTTPIDMFDIGRPALSATA